MLYEDCINLSSYVLENDEPLGEYKANAIYSIACSYHYLGQYEQCRVYLEECSKFPFSYISDNTKLMDAITNGKLGKTESAILQLEDYLKNPSDYNLIYAVTELFNLYLSINDFVTAERLLKYEDWMLESINDERTSPFTKSRLAYFYLLKGIMKLRKQFEEAFNCFIESTCIYMDIGVYDKALVSLLYIKQITIDNDLFPKPEVEQKINTLHEQLLKKASNNPHLVSNMIASLSLARIEIPDWLTTMLMTMSTSELKLPTLPVFLAK
ncbi:tetratricopeptide repeat protein [Paenibacillus donghaensis]|uniref:tetratricopeptide repeat protein n=1 Tax=Paenibacillus donghaensis TaxID=414771 RepID=UPI001D1650AD|nr:hypothetical protein [Paenibacillus donghaensis]